MAKKKVKAKAKAKKKKKTKATVKVEVEDSSQRRGRASLASLPSDAELAALTSRDPDEVAGITRTASLSIYGQQGDDMPVVIVRPIGYMHRGQLRVFENEWRHWRFKEGEFKSNCSCLGGREHCPVCRVIWEDDFPEGLRNELRPSGTVRANAIVRNYKRNDNEDTHLVWRFPVPVRDDIVQYISGEHAMKWILHPKKGNDWKIVRKRTTFKPPRHIEYSCGLIPSPVPWGMKVEPYNLIEMMELRRDDEETVQAAAELVRERIASYRPPKKRRK